MVAFFCLGLQSKVLCTLCEACMWYPKALRGLLGLLLFLALFAPAHLAKAQSLGIGFGLGLPLMDYFTDEVDREYRVTPESGYYPVLKRLSNSLGTVHFHADFLIKIEAIPILSDIEVRFDIARMRWKKSRITHITCVPLDTNSSQFDDATAKYMPLSEAPPECLDATTYKSEKDISSMDMSTLWFFHISGGGRYNFWENQDFKVFTGLHLGVTIATMDGMPTCFGGNIDVIIGISYRLSPLVWIELDAKLLFMATQVPTNTQKRINHDSQTGGNIFTSLVQPNAYVDLQFGIRFDFNAL